MNSIVWTDIPGEAVANEKNRCILENVQKLLKEKTEKSNLLQNLICRCQKLDEHVRNAKQNVKQNLTLIETCRTQLALETNKYLQSEREGFKLKSEIKELIKEYDQRNEYEKNLENNILILKRKIEKLTEKIDWAKICLTEWNQVVAKDEEINKFIKKYCENDESKANYLENKLRNVQDTINKQRNVLTEYCEEQKSLEYAIERTAQLYRKVHQEKQQLVETWKDAVNQMNQRENDIIETDRDLEEAIYVNSIKNQELKEQTNFLNHQINNNKEIEIEINALNNEMSSLRPKLEEEIENIYLNENELNATRKTFEGLIRKLEQQRRKNKQTDKKKSEIEQNILEYETKYGEILSKHEKCRNIDLDTQSRIQELADVIKTEEKAKTELSRDIQRLNELFCKTNLQFNSMKDDEKKLLVHNDGLKTTIQNIETSIRNSKKELQNLVTAAYDFDLKIEHLNIRLAKVKGVVVEKEDDRNQKRLILLEQELESRVKELNQLKCQITKNDEEIKIVSVAYNDAVIEFEKSNNKFKENQLYCTSKEKELKETISKNHEKIVELSVIKMRVFEIEKKIEKYEDENYTLEKHRIGLENLIQKQLTDAQVQYQILFMKHKYLQEEKSTLKIDIGERQIKIDAMKKRFYSALDLLGKNEDGTAVSVTHLIIIAAQERQLLIQEGNELNQKVLQAEDDIKAMENTLSLIHHSNDFYRKTFEEIDENSAEILELNDLQKKYKEEISKLRSCRNCLTTQIQSIEENRNKCENLDKEIEELMQIRAERAEMLAKIRKELGDQIVKISRAERELNIAYKRARQRCVNREFFMIFEKELNLRGLEIKNSNCLQLLANFIEMNAELSPLIAQMLFEKNIKIPPRKPSNRRLFVCQSICSDFSPSERSLKMISVASSRGSSEGSSGSSKAIRTSRSGPSIVSIDFGNGNLKK